MCITFKVQFDTHAPNYTALYPMIPQSRYFYNNFTLNFNDKTYIHTYTHTHTHTHTHISVTDAMMLVTASPANETNM